MTSLAPLYSQDFETRIKAIAAERGITPAEVVDAWVADVRLITPVKDWERTANAVAGERQMGLFTPTVPAADIKMLMGLAFLSTITGCPASELLGLSAEAPSEEDHLIDEHSGPTDTAQTALPNNPDHGEIFEMLDAVQELIRDALGAGKWENEEVEPGALIETVDQFFEAVRAIIQGTST